MVCFSLMDGVSKHLTETLPSVEIIWIRYLVLTALVTPLALRAGRSLIGPGTGVLAVRGLCMLGSGALFVSALSALPIAEATVIGFVSPFLVTILSILMLGEPVSWRRWAALAAGFGGVLVIIRPGTASFTPATLLPLGSATFWAIALVLTRKQRIGPSTTATLVWTALMGVIPGLLPALPVWQAPTTGEWAWGAVGGGLLLLGQYLLILGYRSGRATLLAPFAYSQILWATAIGLLAFGSAPEPTIWAGGALVVASGLYSLRADGRPRLPT